MYLQQQRPVLALKSQRNSLRGLTLYVQRKVLGLKFILPRVTDSETKFQIIYLEGPFSPISDVTLHKLQLSEKNYLDFLQLNFFATHSVAD